MIPAGYSELNSEQFCTANACRATRPQKRAATPGTPLNLPLSSLPRLHSPCKTVTDLFKNPARSMIHSLSHVALASSMGGPGGMQIRRAFAMVRSHFHALCALRASSKRQQLLARMSAGGDAPPPRGLCQLK